MIITNKELPERHKFDEYITPKPMIRAVFNYLREDILDGIVERYGVDNLQHSVLDVLDAGAGTGNWGNIFFEEFGDALPNLQIHGVELQNLPRPEHYNVWYPETDFIEWSKDKKPWSYYDLVIGNPPYQYAHEFLDTAFDITVAYGMIILLLRNSFMESRRRYERYYKNRFLRPWKVIQSVRRISFYYDQTGDKSTNATAYSVFVWKVRQEIHHTKLEWLDWDYE